MLYSSQNSLSAFQVQVPQDECLTVLFGETSVHSQVQLQVPEVRIQAIGGFWYVAVTDKVKHICKRLFHHHRRAPQSPVLIPPSAGGGVPYFLFNECFMPSVPLFKGDDPHVLLHHSPDVMQ